MRTLPVVNCNVDHGPRSSSPELRNGGRQTTRSQECYFSGMRKGTRSARERLANIVQCVQISLDLHPFPEVKNGIGNEPLHA